MKVFYIGFYDLLNKQEKLRAIPLPGRNKMEYLIEVIENNCDRLTIVSPCSAKTGYCGKENIKISDKTNLVLFRSFGNGNVAIRIINRILISIQLFYYLLINVKREDVIISYHSLATMRIVDLIHKIKKIKVIYEFEEIYADVIRRPSIKKKELKIAQKMDAFLFPTILLNDVVNVGNKPYALIHGSYHYEKRRDVVKRNGIITCIFAGNLESRKGAIEAIHAAEYLPSRFEIKIIGFGSEEQIKTIEHLSEQISESSKCKVRFEGLKSGEEYIRYIQSCDIGLCTQDPDAAFTSTSFPSKILSYLANGLHVVSIRIPSIENSAVAPYLSFYDKQIPEQIAKAIMSIDIDNRCSTQEVLDTLSIQFNDELKRLIYG
jgi:hypothetical protein